MDFLEYFGSSHQCIDDSSIECGEHIVFECLRILVVVNLEILDASPIEEELCSVEFIEVRNDHQGLPVDQVQTECDIQHDEFLGFILRHRIKVVPRAGLLLLVLFGFGVIVITFNLDHGGYLGCDLLDGASLTHEYL